MLDAILRRHAEPYAARVAERLAALGVRSGALAVAGFLFCLGAAVDIAHLHYWLGLALLTAGRVLASLDGPVARREGTAVRGAYLDAVLGLAAEGAIPFAFALAEPDRALAAMFLMLGLTVRAAASIGAAHRGGRVGAALDRAGCLIGRTELFLAFAGACLFPEWFSLIAYVVGILCFIGAGGRVAAALAQPA